jgi:hypothetical protein
VETLSEVLVAGAPAGPSELARVTALTQQASGHLVAAGYSELAFETFLDMFQELLAGLPQPSAEAWYQSFLRDESTDYYTWFMRLLTACKTSLANWELLHTYASDTSCYCRQLKAQCG